jgi:hypothetical protein
VRRFTTPQSHLVALDVLLMAAEAYNRGKLDDAKARGFKSSKKKSFEI